MGLTRYYKTTVFKDLSQVMFKMSAFNVDTGGLTMPPFIDGMVHNRLVQFAPHADQTLAQLVDVLVINK